MAASPGNGEDKRQFPRTAVDEFLFQQFQGKILARESSGTVGVALGTILNNNPERVGFIVTNTSAGVITVGFSRGITAGQGMILGPGGGALIMSVMRDGGPTGWELFGIAGAAGLSWYATELIRYAARS